MPTAVVLLVVVVGFLLLRAHPRNQYRTLWGSPIAPSGREGSLVITDIQDSTVGGGLLYIAPAPAA